MDSVKAGMRLAAPSVLVGFGGDRRGGSPRDKPPDSP
jgi:hypothetical protein